MNAFMSNNTTTPNLAEVGSKLYKGEGGLHVLQGKAGSLYLIFKEKFGADGFYFLLKGFG